MAEPRTLTAEEAAEFAARGSLVVRGLLPPSVLQAVLARFAVVVDSLASRWYERGQVSDPLADLQFDERYLELLRRSDVRVPAAWRRILVSPEVYALWRRPELVGVVRGLVGDELFAHGVWNGRPRDPFGRSPQVQWHQDAHYYKQWDPADGTFVSAWIPLVPVGPDSACMEFVDGSHRRGWIERVRLADGEYGVAPDAVAADAVRTVSMEPGDVVFFSATTLHRSTGNTSGRVRWSIDIRFAPATAAVMAKSPRGYYCHSAADPGRVEPFETWARRYEYAPEELLDELTNFEEGYDLDALRAFSRVSPYSDVY